MKGKYNIQIYNNKYIIICLSNATLPFSRETVHLANQK